MQAHTIIAGALISSLAFIAGCGADGPDASSAQVGGGEFRVLSADQGGDVDTHDEQAADMHDEQAADMHDEQAADMHDEQAADMHDEQAADMHDEQAADMHDEQAADEGSTAEAESTPADATVVEVEMVEFGFVSSVTTLPVGEPVVFRFVNTGAVPHEAMFGNLHEQSEFAASDGHGGHGDSSHHGEVAAITLGAGETGEMVLEFDAPGEVWIGCHLPGHYDAGMSAALTIA